MNENILICFGLLILAFADICRAASHFNYDNPEEWKTDYPTCNGDRQSPISLYRNEAQASPTIPKLQFIHYDLPLTTPIVAENNGHTIHVDVPRAINGRLPAVTGGGLNDTYEAMSFHFHWGSPNSTGSEHEIDDTKYDIEMHIVHKNVKFATMDDAVQAPNGVLVLGVMLKRTKLPIMRLGLRPIYDTVPFLSKFKSKKSTNETLTMNSILNGIDTREFFTYEGSLTTPPCSQAVTWFVFPDVMPIDNKYLKRFWTIYDQRGLHLYNNFRPIQDTGRRQVYLRTIRNKI